MRLHRCKERAAIGPIDPAMQDQGGVVGLRGVAEVEIERMQLRYARRVAVEVVRVDVIAPKQSIEEFHLVKVGDLAQFLGNADFVAAIAGRQ